MSERGRERLREGGREERKGTKWLRLREKGTTARERNKTRQIEK